MSEFDIKLQEKKFYNNQIEYINDYFILLDYLLEIELIKLLKNEGSYDIYHSRGVSSDDIISLISNSESLSFDDERIHIIHKKIESLDAEIIKKVHRSQIFGINLPLENIRQNFQLSKFEIDCILVCLSHEVNQKYEKIFAYLNDDITCKRPTLGLVLRLLCKSTEEILQAMPTFMFSTLFTKYILEKIDKELYTQLPFLSKPLQLDRRIINYLLGDIQLDERIAPFSRIYKSFYEKEEFYLSAIERDMTDCFINLIIHDKTKSQKKPLLYFYGPDNLKKKQAVKALGNYFKKTIMEVDLSEMLCIKEDIQELWICIIRECIIQDAMLCIDHIDDLLIDNYKIKFSMLLKIIKEIPIITILFGEEAFKNYSILSDFDFIEGEFSYCDNKESRTFWEAFARDYKFCTDVDFESLSGRYKLTSEQIKNILSMAYNFANLRTKEDSTITLQDIYKAYFIYSNNKIGNLAQKIEPRYSWEDIILPKDKIILLHDICNQLKYRHIVYGQWGFNRKLAYGKGLNVLFSGPSGTGKTMAAEVIANELGLLLFQIDLSQVISKYIGETEKNINIIFKEAENSNAILLFDEADALFGKRTEVKDAHDRYANIETSYLLQNMENYPGVSIMSTNFKSNIDEAFLRRLNFCIDFPFPDSISRKRIWQIAFPKEAPVDINVNFEKIAKGIELSGGNIKNIAVAAAFFAAEEKSTIGLQHIIRAAQNEYKKIGRVWKLIDFDNISEIR